MEPLPAERRANHRLPLRWTLSILPDLNGRPPITAVTENLSRRGFFCIADRPLTTGEGVDCLLRFPDQANAPATHSLSCRAHVVWVIPMENGRFGIGCRVDDYTVA